MARSPGPDVEERAGPGAVLDQPPDGESRKLVLRQLLKLRHRQPRSRGLLVLEGDLNACILALSFERESTTIETAALVARSGREA
jgi:hypothetical protein